MAVTKDAGFPVTLRDTATSTDAPWPTFTTPGTNRMVVAMMLLNGPTANAVSSFTSPNLTWANAVAVVDSGNNWRVEIWTAFAASVVTNEQIDSTYTGSPFYARQSLIIWSFDGSDASGVGNVDSSTTANDGDVSITATAAGSYLVAGLPYRSAGGDIAPLTDSTSEYDAGLGGGFAFNERACSRTSSGAGALTVGFTTSEIFQSAAIAGVEIKAAAAAVPDVAGSPTVVTVHSAVADVTGSPPTDPIPVSFASAALSTNDPAVTFPGTYTPLEDDLVVLFIASTTVLDVVANASLPAGWVNPLGDGVEVNSDAHGVAILYHFVTAGEETAVTLTYTATNALAAAETGNVLGVAVRNVDTTTPIDSINTTFSSTNTVTPAVLASLTGTNLSDNSLVLRYTAQDSTGTYTEPAAHTEIVTSNTNQGTWLGRLDALTTAGADVAATDITPDAGDEYASITVALSKAVAAVPDIAGAPTVVTVVSAVGDVGAQADVAPSSTVVTVVAAVAGVAGQTDVAPSATVVTVVAAVADVSSIPQINPAATVVTTVAATGNVGAQADVTPSATVVTVAAATASIAGQTDVTAAATIVTVVAATADVTSIATVNPAATTVTTVAATGNVAAQADVNPNPTVVTVVAAVANVSGTQDVEGSSTVVTVHTAVAAVSAQADIAPSSTVVNVFAGVGDIAQIAVINPTGTVVTVVAATASVTGHATVIPAPTIVNTAAATAAIGGQADINPAATIVILIAATAMGLPRGAPVARRTWTIQADDRTLVVAHDRIITVPANTRAPIGDTL